MTSEFEVMSLLGKPLCGIPVSGEELAKLEQDLKDAEQELCSNPDDVEKIIMYGRRQAYLWRYRDAIKTFSGGIERFPGHAMLYRHRGHRYITIRRFADAEQDLARSAELNDGDWNIWYHLGLARFLQRDYAGALEAFRPCYALTEEDELMTAILHWYYMTLRMLGRGDEAKTLVETFEPAKIEENPHYYNLVRFYQGKLGEEQMLELCLAGDVDDATMGFGIGMWHLYNDRPRQARDRFGKVIEGRYWAAFGFIGAEAFLAGME